MREYNLNSTQKEALESGYDRVLVDPNPADLEGNEVVMGDKVKLDGKEFAILHVQPVSSGYVYSFKRKVNGKSVNTSQRLNSKKLILTVEATGNASGAKEKPADKAATKA